METMQKNLAKVQMSVHKVENSNKECGQINLYAAKARQKVKQHIHILIQQQFKAANNVSIKQFNNTFYPVLFTI